MNMIEAGARCDKCGRIDTIAYTSDTAVKVRGNIGRADC